MSARRRPPWWTAADDSELALLCFEFTKAHDLHRERCPVCREAGHYCPLLRAALEGILEWREGRSLRSLAAALRARQDFVDWAAAA